MELTIRTEQEILDSLFTEEAEDQINKSWIGDKESDLDIPKNLPATELDLAKAIAEALGTAVVYVKAEAVWYVFDGDEYRKTEGDWFIHKVIKKIASLYGKIIEMAAPVARRSDNATQGTDSDGEMDKLSRHFSVNTKLHSASALDAYTKLLKSELDEVPAELVEEVELLGLEHLLTRTTQIPFVPDFIPSVGIGQIYGESYTGKTLLTLDLALSICAGLPTWMNKDLCTDGPSTVLYVAAEGGQPFWDMVAAWHAEHPAADLSGFKVLDAGQGQTVSITGKETAPGVYGLEHLKATVKKAGITPSLVVLDPQANILAGVDENSNGEMIGALTPIQKWANEEGFLVILVHHAGKKDTGSGRGASAQMGMMDLLVKLTNEGGDLRQLSFDKVKGAAKPQQKMNFRVATVKIPTGSGSSGIAVPEGEILAPHEKSFLDTSINRSKIIHALQLGQTSINGLKLATSVPRDKVEAIIKDLDQQNRITNIGKGNHPKWVLVGDSSDLLPSG